MFGSFGFGMVVCYFLFVVVVATVATFGLGLT
jgi:hypothetical protein